MKLKFVGVLLAADLLGAVLILSVMSLFFSFEAFGIVLVVCSIFASLLASKVSGANLDNAQLFLAALLNVILIILCMAIIGILFL